MKKLMLLMYLTVGFSPIVYAGTIDTFLGNAWTSISASKNFHFLDNASADVFKNLNKHEYYGGTSTYLYKYWHLSANFIALKPLDTRSELLPGAGVKFHVGEWLYTIPQVQDIVDYIGKQSLIDSATLGIGYSRNFSTSGDMVVIYGGLIKRW